MDWSLRESREEYEAYVINRNNSVTNLLYDHYDADISLTPQSASSRYKRILMERVIEKMKGVASSRSVPFMLVIIPAPFDIVDNYAETVNALKYPEYRRSELSDVVEDIARRNQIPYVNLYEPFRENGAGSLYFVKDDDHWNAAGESLASELVAAYIKQQRLLDTAANVLQRRGPERAPLAKPGVIETDSQELATRSIRRARSPRRQESLAVRK